MDFHHVPVLLEEAVNSLGLSADKKSDGVFIDATMGGGGHSSLILERLSPKGRLIGIDRDPDAIDNLRKKFEGRDNVTVIHGNFFDIKELIADYVPDGVDGILADLGMSSHQIDDSQRGFSYNAEAPLDMRMSREGLSAYDVINTYSEAELARILFTYGEEKFSRSIARNIVMQREKSPIKTTTEFADIITRSIPARARRTGGNPCKRSFQAVRIEVNHELDGLTRAMDDMFSLLKVGGVLSIISFHSLEDRAVKLHQRELCLSCRCPSSQPICTCSGLPKAELTFKSIVPSQEEIEANPRSKSARLRSITKLR